MAHVLVVFNLILRAVGDKATATTAYRSTHVAGNMVGVRFADSVEMAEREGNGFDKTETDAFIQDARLPSFDLDRDPAARPRNAQAKRRLIQSSMIPWILTCLFALTSFLLLLERYGIRKFGTYEDRLSTDLCMFLPRLDYGSTVLLTGYSNQGA